MPGIISLTGDGAPIHAETLGKATLGVAFLAREEAGDIVLELREGTLHAVPTEHVTEWPPATLEARLATAGADTVEEIVFRWLADLSRNPWDRVLQMVSNMLLIRGLAPAEEGAGRAAPAEARASADHSLRLMAECRGRRPEIWAALERSFEAAIRRRTVPGDQEGFAENDPWDVEAEADRKRILGDDHPRTKTASIPIMLVVAAITWSIFAAVHARTERPGLVSGLGVFWGLLLVVSRVPLPLVGRLGARMHAWSRRQFGPPGPGARDWSSVTEAERLVSMTYAIPLLAMLTFLVVSYRPLLLLVAVLSAVAAYGLLVRKTGSSIGQYVQTMRISKQEAVTAAEPAAETVASDVEEAPRVAPPAAAVPAAPVGGPAPPGLPFPLEPRTASELPTAAQETLQRVGAHDERGRALRMLRARAVRVLAAVTTALAFVHWAVVRDGVVRPTEMLVPLGFTIVLTARPAAALFASLGRALLSHLPIAGKREMQAAAERGGPGRGIRPLVTPFIGVLWVLTCVSDLRNTYANVAGTWGLVLSWTAFAALAGYLAFVLVARRRLERRFPYRPPLRLVELRVFGNSNLDDFLFLTSEWGWVGTRLRLDGPGTTGRKPGDLLNLLRGRIEDSVVKDEEELVRTLAGFGSRASPQLRFPVNSMQCAESIWKRALDHLLDRADLVVMDLSDLLPEDRGVAYELGRLVDRFPLDRVVLLVSHGTDRTALAEMLGRAWERLPPDSPNADGSRAPRLIDLGRGSQRGEDESLYQWTARRAREIDRRQLVAVLLETAEPRRAEPDPETVKDQRATHWTRHRGVLEVAGALFYTIVLLTAASALV